MALSQDQLAAQMVAQLRILDPSISAEVGTPERKIIDTVAQSLAESQVDLTLLSGSQDLASKFGSDLDAYVGLFSFGRQSGAFAVGFVTFSRMTGSSYDIVIPRGTQVQGATDPTIPVSATFQTTAAVTLVAGATEVIAPIQALISGSVGNVAATTLTQFANLGAPPLGITGVTNALPTTGGSDSESDAELKVRFRNTVFRNVSGTEDQFMALALSTQFSTKALVLGPISRYQEYIQVPSVDDSQSDAPTVTITATATADSTELDSVVITPPGVPLVGNPISGTGIAAATTITDIEGDTYTLSAPYTGSSGTHTFTVTTGEGSLGPGNGLAGQWTTSPSDNPYAKYIYLDVPNFVSNGALGSATVFFRQDTDFTLNAPPLNAGDTYREFEASEIPDPASAPYQPNVTFFNVYAGGDSDVLAFGGLPTPGGILLSEYSYMSAESRNDITRNVLNCVDVYVDGQNPLTADAVVPALPGGQNLFTNLPTDKFFASNFRRIGEPDTPAVVGHIFTGLFWQPVTALPDQIVVGTNTYFLDTHYWAIEDITLLGNTVRSRNGIEWDPTADGMMTGDPDGGPYTGDPITGTGTTSMTISGYTYDKNIIDLQTALEGAKQVTTDVLAHRASTRYLKLDLTVVYSSGFSVATTNATISTALSTFLAGQYFGTTIQLTDLLAIVRGASGVQNVRWSNDLALEGALNRVTETDVNGNPRLGGTVFFNGDFYLLDSELPSLPTGMLSSDTLPGLILRARAQNTFERF